MRHKYRQLNFRKSVYHDRNDEVQYDFMELIYDEDISLICEDKESFIIQIGHTQAIYEVLQDEAELFSNSQCTQSVWLVRKLADTAVR